VCVCVCICVFLCVFGGCVDVFMCVCVFLCVFVCVGVVYGGCVWVCTETFHTKSSVMFLVSPIRTSNLLYHTH